MIIPSGEVSKRSWVYEGRKRSAYGYSLTVIEEDGTRRRYRKQFATRAEAQDALDALREELRNPEPKTEPTPALTLGEAADRYLATKTIRGHTRSAEERRTIEHLKAEFGKDTPLVEITAAKIS